MEQQPFLSNTCEYNEAHLAAAMKVQLRTTQKKKNIFLIVLLSGVALYSAYQYFTTKSGTFLFYLVLTAIMGALLAYINLFLPKITARKQIPLLREKNGGLTFQSQFREEGVAILGPTGEETALTPYSEFARLEETPELLLLQTEAKRMILLDRNRFQGGTEADFRALAAERFPQVLSGNRK